MNKILVTLLGVCVVLKHDFSLPHRLTSLLHKERLAIFLFHGVVSHRSSGVRNYTGKHMQRELFARCIKELVKVGTALSMDDVLHHLTQGSAFPPQAFAITFDDGFENNLSVAAPILGDFSVPATIYVSTEFVDENRMSWIDRIEKAVEHVPSQVLTVDWAKEPFVLGNLSSRIEFLQAVREFVKGSSFVDSNAFADELCDRLKVVHLDEAYGELDRKLTWDQVRTCEKSTLLKIGGHGHSHAILSYLSAEALDRELDLCFGLLQEKGGIGPTHFSYPEGLEHCYSEAVVEALGKRGVRCSPSAIYGTNKPEDSPFHLRRILVG